MKKLVFILLLLVSVAVSAQIDTTKFYISKDYGWTWNAGNFHRLLRAPSDTVNNKVVGSIAVKNGVFYIKSTTSWDAVASASAFVRYTDTAAMLNGRISSISLTTPNVVFSTPVTFSRLGGAWTGSLSLNSQTANTVFAAPNGSSGTPTFRSLVSADIPDLSAIYIKNQNGQTLSAQTGKFWMIDTIKTSGAGIVGGLFSVGSTTEKTSYNQKAIAWNRDATAGTIYDNTGFGYQWTHSKNITAASDVLALELYNTSGTLVSGNVIRVNGLGNVDMSGTLGVTGAFTGSSSVTGLTLAATSTTGTNDLKGHTTFNYNGSTEKTSVSSSAFGFNRNVTNGNIYDNTGFGYQWNHTKSTTATSDLLALQVYNTAGTQVTATALTANGLGQIAIPSLTGNSTIAGNFSPSVTNTYTNGTSSLRWSNTYSVLGDFSSTLTAGSLVKSGGTSVQQLMADGSVTKEWSGSYSGSGNAFTTAFSVSHSLGSTPSQVILTPTSADAVGPYYVSAKGSSTFTITFITAPGVGTNNITFDFIVK